jgi:hypothetical protein
MKKILKNNTDSDMTILNRVIAPNCEYDVPYHFWPEMGDQDNLITKIENSDIIVSNENEQLPINLAIQHIKTGIMKVNEDMQIFNGIGTNAPSPITLDNTVAALSVEIGDVFFSLKRIDHIIGDSVKFKFYLCCNNDQADKWGQAKIKFLTTTGFMDKSVNLADGFITIGPVELPMIPYLIFCAEVDIPTTLFENQENLLFVSVEREEPTGKESPTNPFLVLKYDLEYWKEV